MTKQGFLRNMVLSLIPGAVLLAAAASAQSAQPVNSLGAHFEQAVYDGSTQSGWYSFPGQSPRLRIDRNKVQITSQFHSTVLLSRGADIAGQSAEVSLTGTPASTSSISGLAVLSDAQHAMVIGREGGQVILWRMEPAGARMVAQQTVNSSAPLEFRVTGGDAAEASFYWRHKGEAAWQSLGTAAESKQILAGWRSPLRFGLLLDGPQGSQATFSNYRAASTDVAGNRTPGQILTASLVSGQ